MQAKEEKVEWSNLLASSGDKKFKEVKLKEKKIVNNLLSCF